MKEILRADNLSEIPGLRHGFYTREWGSQRFDAEDLAIHRGEVALSMGVSFEKLLTCSQVHSPDVVTVEKVWEAGARPRADALVTKLKGVALGVITADCGPILYVDPDAGVIGAAHAGWRGALTGVIENTIDAMEKIGARRKHIHAALGPCIGKMSYEVGPKFVAPFLAENPAHERFFRPGRGEHYMFDLPAYIEGKLRAAGIASYAPPGSDTCADEARFFSYRRDTVQGLPSFGRQISAIALAP